LAHWAEDHKPAAAMSTHLMLAWLMWAVVGAGLAVVGMRWSWESAPALAPWIALGTVAAGALKSRVVLDGVARKVVERIQARGDGRCLGGFLSWRTWALVVLMMAGGRVLRGTFAHGVVGPLYIVVGCALILSSRLTWRAWREVRRAA